MKMFKLFGPLLLACLPLAAQAATAPASTVETLHGALIDNMKRGDKLGCAGRVQHMKPAVDAAFDLPFLAQRILRKRWAELSAEQQAQFIAALDDMVVSTYAAQFSSYNDESFSTGATEETGGGNRVVHAKLRHGNDTVNFDYVLRDSGGSWKIVNVIADGVSDLAIRSSQYESVFKQNGFDGLLAHLREQTAKNKTGC